jgi:hypothetical protein
MSPRSTALKNIETFSPTVVSPIIQASGATKAEALTTGVFSLKGITGIISASLFG